MKKSRKGQHEWVKACELVGVPPSKAQDSYKDSFFFKSILFWETLELKRVIAFGYGQQTSLALQGYVLSP